jgi:mitogen-activated protein kinase 15
MIYPKPHKCIIITSLGEMLNGRPAFPGTSTMNQIERIVEVTGMPPKADVEAVSE